MTPLGQGLLTGMVEVDDPQIRHAMDKMLTGASRSEVNETVLELTALTMALCNVLGDSCDASVTDVLDKVFAR